MKKHVQLGHCLTWAFTDWGIGGLGQVLPADVRCQRLIIYLKV